MVIGNLAREGFEVARCRNASEAVRAAQSLPSALWIVDMGEESGSGLLAQMRAHVRQDAAPVLLLAPVGRDQALAQGFREGADDYLVKPFAAHELMARVRNLLRRR
jgi:DNA-binding response OmpR family regulator